MQKIAEKNNLSIDRSSSAGKVDLIPSGAFYPCYWLEICATWEIDLIEIIDCLPELTVDRIRRLLCVTETTGSESAGRQEDHG